jgi:ABC-2 type transport system permease protein
MLKYLLEKEFKQLWRNPFLPKMMLVMPLVMMLVMPWAANQEIRNIRLSVVDHDRSTVSRRLVHEVPASGYFRLTDVSASNEDALKSVESDKSDLIMEIPPRFERNLYGEGSAPVMISANAVNGMKAGLGSQYLGTILNDYATTLRKETGAAGTTAIPQCHVEPRYMFNPRLDYKVFMVPALMVMLLTMMGGFFPALSIVGEKEKGTIEQINVTPVPKSLFVLAKLIPYWVIVVCIMALCLVLAAAVYRLYPSGSLTVIFVFALLYITVVSGLGLVISNYSNTMQEAMFVMWFIVMVLLLMSGLFTPLTSMPQWAQDMTVVNPLRYFIQVMRQVYLKGSGFTDLLPHFVALFTFSIVFNSWAVISYRKSS